MKKFKHLLEHAKKNRHKCDGKSAHFTYILNGKKIVSYGYNRFGTFRGYEKFGYQEWQSQHAEVHAIKRMHPDRRNFKGCTIVNVRLGENNELRLAAPCSCCASLLQAFGITSIYYTVDSGWEKLKS